MATIIERLEYFSDWYRTKAIAACLKLKTRLRTLNKPKPINDTRITGKSKSHRYEPATVKELHDAEVVIIQIVQKKAFSNEIEILKSRQVESVTNHRKEIRHRNTSMKGSSSLYRLDPFLDKDGVLRVGGRIRKASIAEEVKHPIILPRRGHILWLIIKHFHE